jgi:hypothetical protein
MNLPEVTAALLDAETIDRLFADLAACAEVFEVRVKGAADRHADVAPVVSLVAARAMLLSGAVRGVQLLYLHDGEVWSDTLLRGDDGVRLVRMRHENA